MSSLDSVLPHLQKQFESQRLVFWHDVDGEYAEEVGAADLGDVTVLCVANNEYAIKNQVLHDDPEGKFLIYRAGPVPAGTANWLLDLELACGVFTADRGSLIRQELGLIDPSIEKVISEHSTFFRATKRVRSLKELLAADDDADKVRAKMSAVLLGQREHSLLELTRALLVDNASGGGKYKLLAEHGLDRFHWEGAARIYRYDVPEPSVDDFVLWVFRQAIGGFAPETPGALRNIQLDFASFRNDRRSSEALATLAQRAAEDLEYKRSIEDAELPELVDNDLFEVVEDRIVRLLAQAVLQRTMSAREVEEIVRARQNSIWFDGYEAAYEALSSASQLLGELASARFEIESFDEGLDAYREQWFRIDQLYRHFHRALRTTQHSELLEGLRAEVEKHYVNRYLYRLGGSWQRQVDAAPEWRSDLLRSQTRFFTDHIEPILRKRNRKAVVIISDALRYEVADELRSRIRQEDRYEAEISAMLGVLPSYTQLGMAALLPHKSLAHSRSGDPVLVDGQRSDGTANRNKVLADIDGLAIQAEEVLAMSRDELRELYVAHRVLYVYHDRIDAIGDQGSTERQVFEAADDALRDLTDLIKKLTGANATNIFVTADHGFLYQDKELDDASYLSTKPQGDELLAIKRRYVLGRNLKDDPAFRKFSSEDLKLNSDLEIQIPRSIHRLRLPGTGSRFIHGGASLQEIVVPVVSINKKRKSDVRGVNVEVLPETDKITTGQVVVKLFQSEPVSEKVQPRVLRAGIYGDGKLLSNQLELTFDQTSDDKRDRYQDARMLLAQEADAFNNQRVEFRLEEQVPGTTHWRTYQRASYLLRRSFTSDFDF